MTNRDKPLILALPGSDDLAISLAGRLELPHGELEWRRFPDGESYVRVHDDPAGRDIVVLARLDDPDRKLATLLFTADLLREMGAKRIGLVAPYLPYMRQDMRFKPGEAVTSRSFAHWISAAFDWLVTVDPHLHRYASLDEIYSLGSSLIEAAPVLAEWIAAEVEDPVLIGPDGESEQWVSEVAALRNLPWRVFTKKRHGDRDVQMQLPELKGLEDRTPVLIDDIISSGTTMAKAARHLIEAGFTPPLAIGVHGLFGPGSREALGEAGIARIVCTNSVNSAEAQIDLADAIAESIVRILTPVQ